MDAAEGESTHRSVQVQTNYSAAYLAVVYIRIREGVRFGIPEKSFIAFFCLPRDDALRSDIDSTISPTLSHLHIWPIRKRWADDDSTLWGK